MTRTCSEQQTLDFDRYDIWRILVGGSKLSRGFTVEGLLYLLPPRDEYERLAHSDGSMVRISSGYRDLVRLYIARNATFGRKTVDLYEAFESVALDEAAFRDQLEQYAEWDGDNLPFARSTFRRLCSSTFHGCGRRQEQDVQRAFCVEQSEQGFTPSGYPNLLDLIKQNLELWRPIFGQAQQTVLLPEESDGFGYTAFTCVVEAADLLDRMAHTEYLDQYGSHTVEPKLAFYRRILEQGELRDILIVVPQPDTDEIDLAAVGARRVVSRDRRAGRAGSLGRSQTGGIAQRSSSSSKADRRTHRPRV